MSATRTLARVGVGLAAAGVGAALGLAAERVAAGRSLADEDSGVAGLTPYGSLRGRPTSVVTADGTKLYVEVDDLPGEAGRGRVTGRPSSSRTGSPSTWTPGTSSGPRCAGTTGWSSGTSAGTAARPTAPGAARRSRRIGADLARVLEVVAPRGPLVLVGHSMGGMTIMSLADQHAELVHERVVAAAFIATSAGGLADVPWTRNQLLSRVAHRMAPSALSVLARRPELVSRTRKLGSDLEQVLVRRYSFASPVPASLVRFAAEMIASTRIEVVADFLPAFDLHDAREALAALLDTEVLVLGGAEDAMTPPEHSDELALLLPQAEHVVVQDSGHLVMLEHPEVVDRALFALIERGLERSASERRSGSGRRRTVVGLAAARRKRGRQASA